MGVGKSIPQLEGRDKVIGQAIYGADIRMPGLLVGKILRSTVPHAHIKSIDVSKAKKIPGVLTVITAENTPKKKFGEHTADEFPFAIDKVRYIGDEVAAVAAIDEATAEEALLAIEVCYEELPSVHSVEEAMAPGAPVIHEGCPGNLASHIDVREGDVKKAFAESDLILENEFFSGSYHPGYIETINSTASFNNGHLVLWTALQSPARTRLSLSQCMDMPISRIRVISPAMGGGFGAKVSTNIKTVIISAFLAVNAGKPVRVKNSRMEDMCAGRPQALARQFIKTGWKRDGTLLVKYSRILEDNGAYSGFAPAVLSNMAVRADDLYRIRASHTVCDLLYTNNVPTGGIRGFGIVQAVFALDTQFDRAARELGFDPIDLRMKNASERGDTTLHGRIFRSCALKECMQLVRKESRWDSLRKAPPTDSRFIRGIGMANVIHSAGSKIAFTGFEGATSFIRLEEDGRVIVISGEQDCGQGSDTIFAQFASEALNLPLSEISVATKDTEMTPFSPGTFGNRATLQGGNAIRLAADDLKRKMVAAMAKEVNLPEESISIANWHFCFQDTLNKPPIPVKDIARKLLYNQTGGRIQGVGVYVPDTNGSRKTLYGNLSPAYCFGSEAVELEVDTLTGKVTVLKVYAAFDVGTPVNPKALEGQIEGGIVMGLGWTLSETIKLDQNGRMLNPNLTDYKMPTTLDVPPINVSFIGIPDPEGPYGAKSIGQAPPCPMPAAIVNAIYHATGVFLTRMPIDPKELVDKLRERP